MLLERFSWPKNCISSRLLPFDRSAGMNPLIVALMIYEVLWQWFHLELNERIHRSGVVFGGQDVHRVPNVFSKICYTTKLFDDPFKLILTCQIHAFIIENQ